MSGQERKLECSSNGASCVPEPWLITSMPGDPKQEFFNKVLS
jgi:hypothetical protein